MDCRVSDSRKFPLQDFRYSLIYVLCNVFWYIKDATVSLSDGRDASKSKLSKCENVYEKFPFIETSKYQSEILKQVKSFEIKLF